MIAERLFHRPITGRFVLVALLSFFGVVTAVNGVFVYFALNSWPGLVTEKAYERGRDYNQTLDAAQAQKALGWKSAVSLTPVEAGQKLTVAISGAQGDPVDGLRIEAVLRRPVHEGADKHVTFTGTGHGRYTGPVRLGPGIWDAELRVGDPSNPRYRLVHRLVVP